MSKKDQIRERAKLRRDDDLVAARAMSAAREAMTTVVIQLNIVLASAVEAHKQ